MRALVIPVDLEEPIVEVDVDKDDTLKSLQDLVGGCIESIRCPRQDVTAYINEEGKFECRHNILATILMRGQLLTGDWIAGPLVLIGFDPETGDALDLPTDLTVDGLAAEILGSIREVA